MSNDDDIVVRVEGLSKRYLIPQRHEEEVAMEPSLREQLKEFFPGLLGADESDYFWALKDVSFTVRRGEVFGIVGQNGSGKSTLLKILSGVTPPTEGTVELRGRVGSLLEVGTGFHPDLTGRQNIYFNGALLGVPQKEIRKKIDSIIEFSGIGRFIDVPVKRYSSGMYIRLAYSVASLLESDILILDEVLAVGDAAFRAKTEKHMREATSTGKTVLLVSHNPQTVITTCHRALILNHGHVAFIGDSKETIAEYLSGHYAVADNEDGSEEDEKEEILPPASENKAEEGEVPPETTASSNTESAGDRIEAQKSFSRYVRPRSFAKLAHLPRHTQPGMPPPTMVLKWVSIHNSDGARQAVFNTGDEVRFRIGFAGVADPARAYFAVLIHNSLQNRMVTAHSTHLGKPLGVGPEGVVECVIPQLMLGDGLYSVMIDTGVYDFETRFFQSQDCIAHATYIRVSTNGFVKGVGFDEFRGCVHPSNWTALPASTASPPMERRTVLPTEADRLSRVHILSYPKTGNTWARFLLGKYLQQLTSAEDPFLLDGAKEENELLRASGLPNFFSSHGPLTWETQTASDLNVDNVLAPYRDQFVVLMIRHPLDTLLSHYMHHHHQKGHEERRKFESFLDFVEDPVFGLEKFLCFYNLWASVLENRNVFVLRYESLRENPVAAATEWLSTLEIPLERDFLEEAIEYASFENMKAIERSGTVPYYKSSGLAVFATGDRDNPDAYHVRSGKLGGYKDHLDQAVAQHYEKVVREELAPVYGYGD